MQQSRHLFKRLLLGKEVHLRVWSPWVDALSIDTGIGVALIDVVLAVWSGVPRVAVTLVATSGVGVAHTLALVASVTRTVVTVVAVRAWHKKLFKMIM